jgi:hypothetical protein
MLVLSTTPPNPPQQPPASKETRLLQRAIMIGDLKAVKRHLPKADILDCGNYGHHKHGWNKFDTLNDEHRSMLHLAITAYQEFKDTPVSRSQNQLPHTRGIPLVFSEMYGYDKSHNRTRSQFRFEVVRLLLEKAKQQGIVNELFNQHRIFNLDRSLKYSGGINLMKYLLSDIRSDFESGLSFKKNSFTYQIAILLVEAKPDEFTITADLKQKKQKQFLIYSVIESILAKFEPVNAHLAIAVPYQKRNQQLQQYMSLLPHPVRELIINFLRNPVDKRRIVFPLIIRELKLPFIKEQHAVQLLEEPSEKQLEVIEEVLSTSPLVQSQVQRPRSRPNAPSPAHLSIISDSSPRRSKSKNSKSKRKSVKKCPPGKEVNHETGRCIKSCRKDQIRNPRTGRCIKNKDYKSQSKSRSPVKHVKHAKSRDCPPGKELNRETGRCRKSCEKNQVRNSKGRCVKK